MKTKNGISVGDKVTYEYEGVAYIGYVAVIDPGEGGKGYLLRLTDFRGHNSEGWWGYC